MPFPSSSLYPSTTLYPGTTGGGGTTISSNYTGAGALSTTGVHATVRSAFSGTGTLSTTGVHYTIQSSLSGSGTLTTAWSNYVNIDSQFSGSGTLTTILGTAIKSNFTGSGTLSTVGVHYTIRSGLSGSGTLGTTLVYTKRISSEFSGSGSLSTVLSGIPVYADIISSLSGNGYLSTELSGLPVYISSAFSGEGVFFTELGYVVKPAELGTSPLGKLANYNVGTSAVPLNPAEGSGSTPSVNATYLKGLDPEMALGNDNVLTAGNIGTYEGEIVNLTVDRAAANVAVSMSTPLSLLNTEMNLFPYINGSASNWTAARAIDYWSQQCGLFYDKVPGECSFYASAYGHNNAYGASTPSHFYERLTGGTTALSVVGERTVKTFGDNVVSNTAFHEDKNASVPVTLLSNNKLIFSAGVGIRGTGRLATISWDFLDGREVSHFLTITVTSDGGVSATVDGVLMDSTVVPGNADYRIAASLEPLGSVMVGKLSVHTDDLAGEGTEEYAGTGKALVVSLPNTLRLKRVRHIAAGGAGAQMLRWGTYLSVDKGHPTGVPAIQKTLQQTVKTGEYVSGFTGNVWSKLNEYCSIARIDVTFVNQKLTVSPRVNTLAVPDGNFSRFSYSSERRDKYKQVAIVNLQSKADTSDTAVLWRADSVFQIAAREIFETTVQTEHSILNVVNPVAVKGIEPYPYKQGAGQYVVTGADGYIVDPQWWYDNDGKVEVSLTGKEGEIAIKITAPIIDSVRAPYRISEGAGDRPALYISGSGILNKPKEVHISTGARNAKEGFDSVFESPFMAGVEETYDTAMAMASEYSAMNAEVDFEIPNDFDTPSRFGQFPAGANFTDNIRNYRIQSVSQTGSKVSGTAVSHTTIGAYVDSFPEGATIADVKARHFGKSIRQFNITPLRGTSV